MKHLEKKLYVRYKIPEMEKLSEEILKQYEEIALVFSNFQKSSGLTCPPGCGKCCFKKDIFCTPIEMLPMALKLLKEKKAEETLQKAIENIDQRCIFLKVTDEKKGNAYCSEYENRPFICRTFGAAARKNKYHQPDFSICKIIKEESGANVLKEKLHYSSEEELPYIEIWRKRLETIDPQFLESEFPINQSLQIILEKVLLRESFK